MNIQTFLKNIAQICPRID